MGNNRLILDGTKLPYHKDRVEAWLNGEKIAPITIDCALTKACNYKCVYCYGQLQGNKGKSMTRDVIFRFLDDTAEIGVKAVSFVSDGESTCSPHLSDAIIRGKNNGLDLALGTNGALLNEEKIGKILPHLTYLRFNISAGEKNRYIEIHRCKPNDFERVVENVRTAVEIKKRNNLETTIGLQMVLMPEFADQIIPLSRLGKELEVDYLVIKHCCDDEEGSLGVKYERYNNLLGLLNEAEKESNDKYLVKAKWSKILSGGKRNYSQCYGPAFILQISGTGLVAPCGQLFDDRYKKYHMGDISKNSFKEIQQSDRYWNVLDLISSEKFDAKTMCGNLCLHHKVNEYLWDLKQGKIELEKPTGKSPMHINFI